MVSSSQIGLFLTMKVFKQKKWKGGWFIGNFIPSAYKTRKFEVCYKIHKKNEKWPSHYHKLSTEYNYLIRGKMTVCGKTLYSGDFFIIFPHEIASPVFHKKCELIVIKIPCTKNDKYIVI